MRILHLEASPGWGGQEIRILREALGMKERGHSLFFAVMKGAELGRRARAAGFLVYELNFHKTGWLKTFYHLCRMIKKHEIDLINTHSSLDAWIGGLAGRFMKKKIVRTRHLSTRIKPGFNSRFLYGTLADFVVTTCSSILHMISAQSGKPLEKCRSIPTGIDPAGMDVDPQECAAFREKWGFKQEEFLVGTACFMRSWKGIEDFLKAADQLRHIPDLRWVIIGGGHSEKYRALAKEMDLEKIVSFTGHLDSPFPALGALDLFTLLSTAHEGVSQAILQAAWLSKPLVATPTGGLSEVCIDQLTGLQVPVFSPDQVAQAVLKIKENPVLRKQFGNRAHLKVKEDFTWEGTLNQMEEVFLAIV